MLLDSLNIRRYHSLSLLAAIIRLNDASAALVYAHFHARRRGQKSDTLGLLYMILVG